MVASVTEHDALYPLVVRQLADNAWSVFNVLTRATFRTYGVAADVLERLQTQAREWRDVRIGKDGEILPPEECTGYRKRFVQKCQKGADTRRRKA